MPKTPGLSLLEQPTTSAALGELSPATKAKIARTEAPYFEHIGNTPTFDKSDVMRVTKRAFTTGILAAVTHALLAPDENSKKEVEILQRVQTQVDTEIHEPSYAIPQNTSKHGIFPRNIINVSSAISLLISQEEYPADIYAVTDVIDRDRAITSKTMRALRLEGVIGDSVLKYKNSQRRLVEPLPEFTHRLIGTRSWRAQLYLYHTSQALGISNEAAADLLVERGFIAVSKEINQNLKGTKK